MRRPLLLVAAALAVTTLLAACGDDRTTATTDATRMNDGMGSGSMDSDSMGDGMSHGANTPVVDGARRIEVTARSFELQPAEITVQAGEDVAIVLTSEDLLHDFTIDELDTHVAADANDTAEGGLRADTPGRYTFYCTVDGHRAAGMEGTLVVE